MPCKGPLFQRVQVLPRSFDAARAMQRSPRPGSYPNGGGGVSPPILDGSLRYGVDARSPRVIHVGRRTASTPHRRTAARDDTHDANLFELFTTYSPPIRDLFSRQAADHHRLAPSYSLFAERQTGCAIPVVSYEVVEFAVVRALQSPILPA